MKIAHAEAPSAEKHPGAFDRILAAAPWCLALLYLVAIDRKGIWTDEGIRYGVMSGGLSWAEFSSRGSFAGVAEVLRAVGYSLFQPLYHLLANALVRLTGSHSELLLRGLNIALFVVAMKGVLRFFRRDPALVRFFALAVFALNGFMLMHVLQVREYTLYVTLVVWSSCLCFELLDVSLPSWRRDRRTIVAHGLLAALLFYSHVYSVFALTAQAAVLAWRREQRAARLRAAAIAYGIAAALAAPWLVATLFHFPTKLNPGGWDGGDRTWARLFDRFEAGWKDLIAYGQWEGQPLLQLFTLVVVVGVPVSLLTTRRANGPQDLRVAYALIQMSLLAAFQIGYFFALDPFATWARYFLGYFFGYTVLCACAFARLLPESGRAGGKLRRLLAVGIGGLVLSAGLWQIRLYWRDPFMDTPMSWECNWRILSARLLQHSGDVDALAVDSPILAWTLGVSESRLPPMILHSELPTASRKRFDRLSVLVHSGRLEERRLFSRQLGKRGFRDSGAVDIGCRWTILRFEEGPADAQPPRRARRDHTVRPPS